MDKRPFPQHFYRGLRKEINKAGHADWEHFQPVEGKRKDGWSDASINWDDDRGAVVKTLQDRSNAKFGAAKVPTSALEVYRQVVEITRGKFDAERRATPDNDYHGNLLFSLQLPTRKLAYKTICNHLALSVCEIVPPPAEDKEDSR